MLLTLNFNAFLVLILYIFVFSAIVIILHLSAKYISEGPLYGFVASTIVYVNTIAIASIQVYPYLSLNYSFSIYSPTLIVGVLAVSLLIYLERGTKKARTFLTTIFIAGIISFIFPLIINIVLKMNLEGLQITNPIYLSLYSVSMKVAVASTLTILFDIIIMVIIFQFLMNLFYSSKHRVFISGTFALIIASIADAILFPLFQLVIVFDLQNSIFARLPVFVLSAILYALIFSIYIHIRKLDEHIGLERPIFDIISRHETFVPLEIFLRERDTSKILFDVATHNLRNALQIQRNAIDLLKKQKNEVVNSTYIDAIETAYKKMEKISFAISSIKTLHYITDNEIKGKVININTLVSELVERGRISYPQMNIILKEDVEDYCFVQYNPLLENAIFEIIENAVNHPITSEKVHSSSSNIVEIKLVTHLEKRTHYAQIIIKDYEKPLSEEVIGILLDPLKKINKRIGIGFVLLKAAIDFSKGFYEIKQKTDEMQSKEVIINIPIIKKRKKDADTIE